MAKKTEKTVEVETVNIYRITELGDVLVSESQPAQPVNKKFLESKISKSDYKKLIKEKTIEYQNRT